MSAFFAPRSNSSSGSDFSSLSDTFWRSSCGSDGFFLDGSVSESPVNNNNKKKKKKQKMVVMSSEDEALAAVKKSHSESERRRRERINSHLDTLRQFVPGGEKMDKATLLAEVIKQVKELKKNAVEASKGLLIPMDTDEVLIEHYNEESGDGATFSFKASICCDYRQEVLSDLRQAVDTLKMKMVKAEVSTLGNRLTNVFVFSTYKEGGLADDKNGREILMDSIRKALSSVSEKAAASLEYSPRMLFSSKRRRLSYFDCPISSS